MECQDISKREIDVSVIILTYRPDLEALKKTLLSVLLQKGIQIEVIITDDGSGEDFSEELISAFQQFDFTNYKFIFNDTNTGTCENFLRGINEASGLYVKGLSPGDYLYEETILRDWFEYMIHNNIKVCFGMAAYYRDDKKTGTIKIINARNHPANLFVYKIFFNKKSIFENYLLNWDVALGATFLTERNITREYLMKVVGKVKYAEDHMYRIMLVNGEMIHFFDRIVILYQYGTGVSTRNDPMWNERLKNDVCAVEQIIVKEKMLDDQWHARYRQYIAADKRCRKCIKLIYFPRTVVWKFIEIFFYTHTPQKVDLLFYQRMCDNKESKGNCK